MNPVSEYVVKCDGPIQGVFEDQYTEAIGYVAKPKGKPLEYYFFRFSDTPATMVVSVFYRMKSDGSLRIASCAATDRWSVCMKTIP